MAVCGPKIAFRLNTAKPDTHQKSYFLLFQCSPGVIRPADLLDRSSTSSCSSPDSRGPSDSICDVNGNAVKPISVVMDDETGKPEELLYEIDTQSEECG